MSVIPMLFVCIHVIQWQVREYRYGLAVKGLSDVLKPGTTRGDVEQYVGSKGLRFLQGCSGCATWTDFVIIGDEKAGWLCEEQYIYAAFDFKATEPHDRKEAHVSDRLVKVYPDRSACLTFP